MPGYVVAGGEFTPFTYDELVRPLEQATEAHMKTQDELDALSMQAGDIGSQIGDDSPQARAMYEAYEQSLRDATEELYRNGYGQKAARALSDARRRYQGDIGRISHAMEARKARVDEYNKQVLADPSLLTSMDPSAESLDKWLNDGDYGSWRQHSGYKLYDQSSKMAENLQRQLTETGGWSSILSGQQYQRFLRYGVTADDVNRAYENVLGGVRSEDGSMTAALENIMTGVLSDSGITEWADAATTGRALEFIRDGLYSGIGKGAYETVKNEDHMTPYQRAMLNRESTKSSGGGGGGGAAPLKSSGIMYHATNLQRLNKNIDGAEEKSEKLTKQINTLDGAIKAAMAYNIQTYEDYEALMKKVAGDRVLRKSDDISHDLAALKQIFEDYGKQLQIPVLEKRLKELQGDLNGLYSSSEEVEPYMTETAHRQFTAQYMSLLGVNDDTIAGKLKDGDTGLPLSVEKYEAFFKDGSPRVYIDYDEGRLLFRDAEKPSLGTISGDFSTTRSMPGSLPSSLLLAGFVDGMPLYENLPPEVRGALDDAVMRGGDGGQVGMSLEEMLRIVKGGYDYIDKYGDPTGDILKTVNSLNEYVAATMNANGSYGQEGQSQTGASPTVEYPAYIYGAAE